MTSLETLQASLADRYTIEKEIGSGGMATVYLARDIRHKRDVALKVLKPELGAVLGTERFLSEITVTANLQHPNLLPLFDSGEAGGLLFYVMPFVTGETLRAKLDREKQLSVDEAVRIAVAVASALQYAHEHGVIHRDLKPENILLQSGVPVIADFGIALAVQNAGGARVTQTGLSLGTPQYMSPEQATGDREIGPRSDIYSLGAVTYEMLSGEPPHTGNSAQAIIAKLMTSEPQPLNTLRSTIPFNVVCAVEKSLAKLPADRFTSAKEFADALQNPHFTIATRAGASQSVDAKRWKRFATGAFIAAALFAALSLWAFLKPAPKKPVFRYALGMDTADMIGGSLSRLAVSPDGSKILYTITGNKLMLRERNQLQGAVVPIGEVYSPFFAPDGTRAGYVGPPSNLYVFSLSGGPALKITDSVAAPGASFGFDGNIYATSIYGHGVVKLAETPGAPLTRITRVDSASSESTHIWPELLPDGKRVLFTITYLGGKPAVIAVVDVKTKKYRKVVNGIRAHLAPNGDLLYVTPDGTLMMAPFDPGAAKLTGEPQAVATGLRVAKSSADFTVTRDGTLVYVSGGAGGDREVVWVSHEGVIEQVDPAWKGNFQMPALSPDGRRLALAITSGGNQDIWIKQLNTGPALKLTFEGTQNVYPTWTPDGRSVTYDGNVAGGQDLYTKRADGSAQAVKQLDWRYDVSSSLWSRDGKWLIVRTSVNSNGNGDIGAMRPGIDSVPTMLINTPFHEISPTLSPDGRYLAYTSDETGRSEVYVVPFPDVGSAKWPVSTGGGREPLWSRSGREIFYRRPDRNLVSVAVSTSPTFSAGLEKVLFSDATFASTPNNRGYDITPDDKRFIFLRSASTPVPDKLIVVENWLSEIKQKH